MAYRRLVSGKRGADGHSRPFVRYAGDYSRFFARQMREFESIVPGVTGDFFEQDRVQIAAGCDKSAG